MKKVRLRYTSQGWFWVIVWAHGSLRQRRVDLPIGPFATADAAYAYARGTT